MRHTWVESKTAARATDNTDQNWTTEEHGSNSTTETRINTDQTQPRNTDQHGSVSSS